MKQKTLSLFRRRHSGAPVCAITFQNQEQLRLRLVVSACLWLFASISLHAAAAEELTVPKWTGGTVSPVPVSISGFSDQIAAVLSFDLAVQGCEIVPSDKARFSVTGTDNGQVTGALKDVVIGTALFNHKYEGGPLRGQAHSLANDVIEKIFPGQRGIARTKIAFVGEVGGKKEIYISDYDGANPIKITSDGANVAAPAWAPARGPRILYYMSYRSHYPDIYLHNLDTGERRAVAKYSGLNTSPAVSPDGQHLAMILSKSGNAQLHVADADGTNVKQLTKISALGFASSPCWSPDGKKICYVVQEGQPTLYAVSAEGGTPRRIRTANAGRVTEPDWSPDGKWIAFTVQRGKFEICVVPADGGEAITFEEGEDPVWAPNSRTLIFARDTRGKRILSLLDVFTKRVKDVPHSLGNSSQPSWQR